MAAERQPEVLGAERVPMGALVQVGALGAPPQQAGVEAAGPPQRQEPAKESRERSPEAGAAGPVRRHWEEAVGVAGPGVVAAEPRR